MFERELTTEEKLKLEIERLKEQNQRERSDISVILWVIFMGMNKKWLIWGFQTNHPFLHHSVDNRSAP